MGKKLLLHVDFDPQRIGAKEGDRIGVQLLYCRSGWDLLAPGLEKLAAWHDWSGPEMLLSNRVTFVAE